MAKQPYHFVRHVWINRVDLKKISKDLSKSFHIETLTRPSDDREISFFKNDRETLRVKGNTLIVRLSPFRAVLFQKEPAPFTEKDMELKKRIFELYPHSKIIPLKFAHKEPKITLSTHANAKAKDR